MIRRLFDLSKPTGITNLRFYVTLYLVKMEIYLKIYGQAYLFKWVGAVGIF